MVGRKRASDSTAATSEDAVKVIAQAGTSEAKLPTVISSSPDNGDPNLRTVPGATGVTSTHKSFEQWAGLPPRRKPVAGSRDEGKVLVSPGEEKKPRHLFGRSAEATTLYGRETEQKIIFDSIERCYRSQSRSNPERSASSSNTRSEGEGEDVDDDVTPELIVIGGAAGIGKSSLATKSRDFVKERSGFWCYGKFDSDSSSIPRRKTTLVEPFSAFRAACGSLLKDVAQTEAKGTLQNLLKEIIKDDDEDLLLSFIPELCKVLDDGNSNSERAEVLESNSNSSATKHQGKPMEYIQLMNQRLTDLLFRLFQQISSIGPLVIVLDDMQNADKSSLALLESLASGQTGTVGNDKVSSVTHAVIILTYRDDETHPFLETVEKLNNDASHTKLSRISPDSLNPDHVNALLSDYLESSLEETKALATCVHQKTAGNPFYLRRFLMALQVDQLVRYDCKSVRWKWDADEIRKRSMVTENVVNLLKAKLQELPLRLFWNIPRIACLGTKFPARVFKLVLDHYQDEETLQSSDDAFIQNEDNPQDYLTIGNDTESYLSICIEDGLLIEIDQGWYRWEHDKVREAALQLVEPFEVPRLKYEMGEVLLDTLSPEDLQSLLFVVVGLLNSGTNLKKKHKLRLLQISKLNYEAGKITFASSAFEVSSEYLDRGLELLPSSNVKWSSPFRELSLQMYSLAAESNFCIGNFERAIQCCDAVLRVKDIPLLEKRRAYTALLRIYAAQGRNEDGVALSSNLLEKLNCRFPPKIFRKVSIVTGLLKVRATVDKTIAAITASKKADDDSGQIEWTNVLLDQLVKFAYFNNSDLFPLGILKGLQLTMQYGVNDVTTAPILATIALMLLKMGSFEGARKYAELSLKLMSPLSESRTIFLTNFFVFPFLLPDRECVQPLKEGIRVGFRSGDIESALFCATIYLEKLFHVSYPLPEALAEFESYTPSIEDASNQLIIARTTCMWQLIYNLSNPTSKKHILKGDIFTDDHELELARNDIGSEILYRFKMMLSFWFTQHTACVDAAERIGAHKDYFETVNGGGNPSPIRLYAFLALSCISVARKRDFRKYISMARNFLNRVSIANQRGDPNYRHFEPLINAELLSASGKTLESRNDYEKAILLAKEMKLTSDQALAHERYADQLRREQMITAAREHFVCALNLYEDWGAMAKVAQLRRVAGGVLEEKQ